nr:MAG TPA: hypothetical protein [Caudoviricetes sp.]
MTQCKRRNKPTAKGDGIKKTSEKEEQKKRLTTSARGSRIKI